jgi:long-subunit fatty acid transport protein
MKKLITVLAVLAFSLSMPAQNTSQPSQSQSQSDQANQSQSSQSSQATSGSAANNPSSGEKMSGKVSSNGKSFTDDASGKSYTVTNPDALQSYQNQHVVVLVHADPDTGNLTITAVQPPQ